MLCCLILFLAVFSLLIIFIISINSLHLDLVAFHSYQLYILLFHFTFHNSFHFKFSFTFNFQSPFISHSNLEISRFFSSLYLVIFLLVILEKYYPIIWVLKITWMLVILPCFHGYLYVNLVNIWHLLCLNCTSVAIDHMTFTIAYCKYMNITNS